MGFKQRANTGSKFIRFKQGKLVSGDSTHDAFEGMPIDLEIVDDEFEKKPYRKVILYLVDPDTAKLVQLEFSTTSGYGRAFASICQNINPNMPIEISGSSEKGEGGLPKTSMFIRQGDKPLKWAITKENAAAMKRPEPKDVVIGTGKNKKTIQDWTAVEEYNEKVVMNWREKLVKVSKGLVNFEETWPDADTTKADDIPF